MRPKKKITEKLLKDMARLLDTYETAHGNRIIVGAEIQISPRRKYGWNGQWMMRTK